MLPPAISALDLEVIHVLDDLRVAQNIIVSATDIATEQVAEFAAAFLNVQDGLGRAEDVASISKGDRETIHDRKRPVVIDGDKLSQGGFRIVGGIKRLNWRQAM